MKPSRHITLSKLSFALIITSLTMILVASAWAEPTVQPRGGKTCVQLDDGFVGQLVALNISPGVIKPAFLRKGKVCFPIRGGGIDLEDLRGEIIHTGGLALMQEKAIGDEAAEDEAVEDEAIVEETIVELTTFIIDTTGAPVLTGLVIVDGTLLGRVPLFNLDLSEAIIRQKYKKLSVRNVVLTLTETAANALNGVFESPEDVVGGFEEFDPVGVAKVSAYLLRAYDKGCEL